MQTDNVLHAVWKHGRHCIPRHNSTTICCVVFLIEPRIVLKISRNDHKTITAVLVLLCLFQSSLRQMIVTAQLLFSLMKVITQHTGKH